MACLEAVEIVGENQAFKRACSCFGLGRYLYHFTGVWVELDQRKRPKIVPKLVRPNSLPRGVSDQG
jgi:hypothetical protein